ncbi:CaiB/BaiF CoA transferase family protein [Steroidobacter agaridevorans]|uniref:CaiB/BaiF CoA transferase family protein n=1 Tax=Steroidobacter agaridevorans TaxID=2695856 RepID=UPI00132A1F0C|nr:CoA transferase [Steroidobacter agaridevorans]GFE87376.1 formyl-CoA transferase [Steroidobacter agaridevorans]
MAASDNEVPTAPAVGPLHGVLVLDLTRVVAGPYCTMMLADLGATVIKIENPQDPDYVRTFPPMVEQGAERLSGFFAQYNRHKLGVTLDLKSAQGRELFLDMVSKAHVVVENFRPGTMRKLGLGFDELRKVNPRLIYTGISGFGQSGPNSARPAYDNSAQASGGLWSMNGMPGEPQRVGTIIGDLAASLYAALGTVAALREAESKGVGRLVDISQQDAVFTLTENAVVNFTAERKIAQPLGNDHPFVRPYGRYECKDGHVFFGAYTDKFWQEACSAFGTPALATDPEIDSMEKRFDPAVYARRVEPIIRGWFADKTKQELEAIASDRFPLSPIKNIAEVVEDPHMLARDMLVQVAYGEAKVKVFGSAVHLSGAAAGAEPRVPTVGEHNEAIYLDWLGLDRQSFESLCESKVI